MRLVALRFTAVINGRAGPIANPEKPGGPEHDRFSPSGADPWHSCAGGGAVHSINNSAHIRGTLLCRAKEPSTASIPDVAVGPEIRTLI